ncbi:MAG: hypothetical protein JW818_13205 [Pirellulales bacterium]|nr:hypothetical protein [Pirellulales bacterium]
MAARLMIPFVFVFLCAGCGDGRLPKQAASVGPVDFTLEPELRTLLALPEDGEMEFNMNVIERDSLLGLPDGADASGDITRFDKVDVETVEKLIRGRWADPRDRQNESPSIAEIFRFMKRWPQVKTCGYAVSSKRDDYRVSLEGISVEPDEVSPELKTEFIEFANGADELETDRRLYAWWD